MLKQLYNGIDYAGHDIRGYYKDEEYKVFQFQDYGIKWIIAGILIISAGEAGIMIEIHHTRKHYDETFKIRPFYFFQILCINQ